MGSVDFCENSGYPANRNLKWERCGLCSRYSFFVRVPTPKRALWGSEHWGSAGVSDTFGIRLSNDYVAACLISLSFVFVVLQNRCCAFWGRYVHEHVVRIWMVEQEMPDPTACPYDFSWRLPSFSSPQAIQQRVQSSVFL